MFPLLQKDGLTLAYTAAVIGFHVLVAPRSSGWRYVDNARRLSLLGMVAIHALAALTEPPVSSPPLADGSACWAAFSHTDVDVLSAPLPGPLHLRLCRLQLVRNFD